MNGIYWIASYPKSGNTWFRTFISNLTSGIDGPININEISTGSIASSRFLIEQALGFDTGDLTYDEIDQLRPSIYEWALKESNEVGYYKIHDAYAYTKSGKPIVGNLSTLGVVYIIRNPLDVAVSSSHHWGCSLDDAITRMSDSNNALSSDVYGFTQQVRQNLGTWSHHVRSWTEATGLNIKTIRYEDMIEKPVPTFTDAVHFLSMEYSEQEIRRAIKFSEFNELAKQESMYGFREKPTHSKRFFRSGTFGGWRDVLTKDQHDRIVMSHKNTMKKYGYI